MTHRIEQAEDFNARVPVGTPVRYWPVRGRTDEAIDTVTRSESWKLGDGTPVVLVEGVGGCVHIESVRVLPAQAHARGLEEAAGMATEWAQRESAAHAAAAEEFRRGLCCDLRATAYERIATQLHARAEAVRRGEG